MFWDHDNCKSKTKKYGIVTEYSIGVGFSPSNSVFLIQSSSYQSPYSPIAATEFCDRSDHAVQYHRFGSSGLGPWLRLHFAGLRVKKLNLMIRCNAMIRIQFGNSAYTL